MYVPLVTIWIGDKYSDYYPGILARSWKANHGSGKLLCMTDPRLLMKYPHAQDFHKDYIDFIHWEPKWKGWWSKLHMFNVFDFPATSPFLFVDVDSVFIRDVREMMQWFLDQPPDVYFGYNFWIKNIPRTAIIGMMDTGKTRMEIYNRIMENQHHIGNVVGNVVGDQEVLYHALKYIGWKMIPSKYHWNYKEFYSIPGYEDIKSETAIIHFSANPKLVDVIENKLPGYETFQSYYDYEGYCYACKNT